MKTKISSPQIDDSADHREIARMFSHCSDRTYATEQRRLRLEDDEHADHPLTQQLAFN